MTRRLVALGLAGLALLSYIVQATSTQLVSPADAAAWEGQTVAMRGVVRDLRVSAEIARFDLVLDGHAVAVRLEGDAMPEGTPVEVRGRLGRLGGVLTLLAEHLTGIPFDEALPVSLAALAQDPETWKDHPINVTGVVDHGRLKADGHSIALGTGTWPRAGAVNATVILSYHPQCACHQLNRVAQWTS